MGMGARTDRAALATRNRTLAARRHRPAGRARVRRWLLTALARLRPARTPWAAAPVRPDSILLIRPDHVGDVLFTTPAIRALARVCPGATITALAGPWSAGVLAPFIDSGEVARVLTLDFPGFTRRRRRHRLGWLAPYFLAWRSARKLRRLGAAVAVIMRPDHWWGALLAYLAGIPIRIGYDLPGVAPFLTETVPFTPNAHSVRLNLNLVARTPCARSAVSAIAKADAPLDYPLWDEDVAYIDSYLAEQGCAPGARVVVIHSGSGSVYKAWSAERWATVADALTERLAAQVVLTGAANEARLVRSIARGMRAAQTPIIAVGDTTIGQLAALCARAELVLGPDSGPLHLAVSVGTPTVHLYGPADPAVYGPWGSSERHAVLQSTLGCVPCGVLDWSGDDPANHPCLREISVAQVLAAATAVLA